MVEKRLLKIGLRGSPLRVDISEGGVLLNELATRLDILAHEDRENAIGLNGVLNVHLAESTLLGVHGRIEQLLRVHLTETFITLDVDRAIRTAFGIPLPYFSMKLSR